MSLHGNKVFHFHPRCKKIGLIHVCFADDLLLFTKGDTSSIHQLIEVLDKFAKASGLKANHLIINIYFGGVRDDIK